MGLPAERPPVTAVDEPPTVSTMSGLITGDPRQDRCGAGRHRPRPDAGDTHRDALPEHRSSHTPAHAVGTAPVGYAQARPVVGRLHMFETTMEIPDGQAHDSLGRRAIDPRALRQSRRRRGRAALGPTRRVLPQSQSASGRQRAVDRGDAEHRTWRSTADAQPWVPGALRCATIDQLAALGFDEATVLRMAQAEHEDWCRFFTVKWLDPRGSATMGASTTTIWFPGRRSG